MVPGAYFYLPYSGLGIFNFSTSRNFTAPGFGVYDVELLVISSDNLSVSANLTI